MFSVKKKQGSKIRGRLASLVLSLVMVLVIANIANAEERISDEKLFEFLGISPDQYIGHEDVLDVIVDDKALRDLIDGLYNQSNVFNKAIKDLCEEAPNEKMHEDDWNNLMQAPVEDVVVEGASWLSNFYGIHPWSDTVIAITQGIVVAWQSIDVFTDAVAPWLTSWSDKKFLRDHQIKLYTIKMAEYTGEIFDQEKFIFPIPYFFNEINLTGETWLVSGEKKINKQAQEVHEKIWLDYRDRLGKYLADDKTGFLTSWPENENITPAYVEYTTVRAWQLAYSNYIVEEYRQVLRQTVLDLISNNPRKLISLQSLQITNGPYLVGQVLNASFVIKNNSSISIKLRELCLAGRDENMSVYDFTKRLNMEIGAEQEYTYNGTFVIPKTGPFWFFPAYLPENGEWITDVPSQNGEIKIKSIYAYPKPEPPPPEPKLADLVVEYINAPSSVEAGEMINVSFKIKNQGQASSGSFVNFVYLSKSSSDHDFFIKQANMSSISPGSVKEDLVKIKIPMDLTGYYYLVLQADADEIIGESNKKNNKKSKQISIIMPDPVFDIITVKSWEFNTPKFFQGWEVWGIEIHNGLRQIDVDAEGHLVLNPDKDPRMFAPKLEISTAECDTLTFSMISYCKDTKGSVYIDLGSKTAIENFTVKPGWNTYEIYFGDQDVWFSKIIQGMRIDPVENGDINDYDDIAFDWIRLGKRIQKSRPVIIPTEPENYYSLSGRVHDANGYKLTNTKISLFGNDTKTAYADANGEYEFSFLKNGNYVITPFKQGYFFNPISINISITDNSQINKNFIAYIPETPDTQAPSTSSFILGTKVNGYYNPAAIKLISCDNNSVSYIEHRINSESWTRDFSVETNINTLPDGENKIYFYAVDQNGNQESMKSIALKADQTRPSTPVVIDDGEIAYSLRQINASWTSEDKVSGISEYRYSIGTFPEESDIIPWTSSTSTKISQNDLNLKPGQEYYISVQAKDKAGNWSEIGYSDGITIDQSLPVEMVSFTAKILENAIILKWQTATETNNLGFNIYRSQSQYGRYQKINSKLIKGAGTNAVLCKYSFQDEDIDPSQTYFYYIEDIDFFGNTEKSQIISVMPDKGIVIMINKPWASLENKLLQNFPNPFNPETWIPYELAEQAEVEIRIFNYYGNLVKILYLGKKLSGVYYDKNKSAYWDGKNEIKESAASGIYFYQIKAGKFTAFKKMILLK